MCIGKNFAFIHDHKLPIFELSVPHSGSNIRVLFQFAPENKNKYLNKADKRTLFGTNNEFLSIGAQMML
jgi:hypothetical protein